jgi:hypothetical protein
MIMKIKEIYEKTANGVQVMGYKIRREAALTLC